MNRKQRRQRLAKKKNKGKYEYTQRTGRSWKTELELVAFVLSDVKEEDVHHWIVWRDNHQFGVPFIDVSATFCFRSIVSNRDIVNIIQLSHMSEWGQQYWPRNHPYHQWFFENFQKLQPKAEAKQRQFISLISDTINIPKELSNIVRMYLYRMQLAKITK